MHPSIVRCRCSVPQTIDSGAQAKCSAATTLPLVPPAPCFHSSPWAELAQWALCERCNTRASAIGRFRQSVPGSDDDQESPGEGDRDEREYDRPDPLPEVWRGRLVQSDLARLVVHPRCD
jgi:hypothetical protein